MIDGGNNKKKNDEIWEYRMEMFRRIIKEQFQLAYFGRIDYGATDLMFIGERRLLYNTLVDQKQEEKNQQDRSIQEAQAKSRSSKSSNSWRRKK